MMKVALYSRVSRDDLNCENQKKVLYEWVGREKLELDCDYYQEEMSSRKTRPIKEGIIQSFRAGKYDTIVVTRIDRFARSLQELVMDIEGIINANGRFVAIMNGFDFNKRSYNASQQLMLNIFASFAQFEREIIRERTIEGLARVKAHGKKLGRPKGTDMKKAPPIEAVKHLLGQAKDEREIAKMLESSRYRVRKVIEKIKQENEGGITTT